jgi:hypothetical protein
MPALLEVLSRDRLTAPELAEIFARHQARPGFVAETLATLEQLDPDHACRAVWLLRKSAAETPLSESDLGRIVELVDASGHWIYQLTLCQLFSETGCPPALRDQLIPFLQRCFSNPRVFIRAWSLTAMNRFRDDPAYRSAIRQCERVARRDPAKSMQARLRHLAA